MRAYQLLIAALLANTAAVPAYTGAAPPAPSERPATISVDPRQWGVSTRYVGGTEGNRRFDIADFTDSGVNTLRIYGDMSRFEPVDDDGRYGSPSIAEIKANPDVIPWPRWDAVMDSPYSSDIVATPPVTWRRVFTDLRRTGVRVVISLRNRDAPTLRPEWIAAVPTTEADWNEWWEYVFAIAYWLNVRNSFGVDEYEVLNEPDNTPQQGWLGTRAQYGEMVRKTDDALRFLYRRYLPGRAYHLHAPVTAGPAWVAGVLADVGDRFDSLNVHNYAWWDKGAFVREMHRRLTESGHAGYPIWLSEWGTYDVSYDEPYMGLALIENLIRFSQPGDDYVYGSHVFSFCDWTYEGSGHWGMISGEGERRRAYYALRLAIRALAGGKPTFQARTRDPYLLAIATKAPDGTVNLLVLNWSDTTSYRLSADLSGLLTEGTGTIRQFSADVRDDVVGTTSLAKGSSRFRLPPWSAVVVQYRGNEPRGPRAAPK